MIQNTDCMQDDFYEYMNSRLKFRGITLKDVCDGIIDTDKLYKYMNQQLSLSKLVRDRLLDRMGGSDYDYEYYLLPDEYALWEKRQKLVRSILSGENLPDEAFDTADIFSPKDETDGRLPEQFVLALKVQQMKRNGDYGEEYVRTLIRAIKLTVPDFDGIIEYIDSRIDDSVILDIFFMEKSVEASPDSRIEQVFTTKKRLGCQELALILDYTLQLARPSDACGENNHGLLLAMKLCLSFLKYIPREFNEQAAIVSIYPKAVCTLCGICNIAGKENSVRSQLLEYIDEAVEMLGPGMRTYYIWELLDYREHYTGKKDELKAAIEYAYNLVKLEVRTVNDAYLYIETEVFDAATVVDVRRRMFGMTKKELCKDLCTEVTLLNFLNKKRNPHLHTVRVLFDRLKMGTQLIRADIVSGSYENRMDSREIRKLSARRNYEEADELNNQLMDKIDMNCVMNIRAVKTHSICYRFIRKEIDSAQHREEFRKLLEMTIDVNELESKMSNEFDINNIFLTGDELVCLYNMYRMDANENEAVLLMNICCIYEDNFFQKTDLCADVKERDDKCMVLNCANRYALIMNNVAHVYAKIGDYDLSNKITIDLIKRMLLMRRMNYVSGNIYSLWWNKGEQYGYDKLDISDKYTSETIIQLCHWVQKYKLEERYKDIMLKYYKNI